MIEVLWIDQAVPAAGLETRPVGTHGYERKTFWIKSNQAGTLYIRAWNEQSRDHETFDSINIVINTLTPYMTTHGAREMLLFFDPTADATVSAWAVLEGI